MGEVVVSVRASRPWGPPWKFHHFLVIWAMGCLPHTETESEPPISLFDTLLFFPFCFDCTACPPWYLSSPFFKAWRKGWKIRCFTTWWENSWSIVPKSRKKKFLHLFFDLIVDIYTRIPQLRRFHTIWLVKCRAGHLPSPTHHKSINRQVLVD